jgi:L-threonylcarbamoyladenylate synthase
LTVILPRRECVPDLVTAGKSTVAVRIPAHPLFREVLRLSGRPLAAPSANPFGYVSPTTADHVRDSLGGRCPWIVDGGPCAHGVESSIVDLTQPDRVRLLRPGPISLERLQAALGPIDVVTHATSQDAAQDAPGMLERHYSPNIPVLLFERGAPIPTLPPGAALVLQARRDKLPPRTRDYYLSERGDAEEAAHALFALLRRIDREHHSIIVAELAAPAGIGAALNDRLRRAAAR